MRSVNNNARPRASKKYAVQFQLMFVQLSDYNVSRGNTVHATMTIVRRACSVYRVERTHDHRARTGAAKNHLNSNCGMDCSLVRTNVRRTWLALFCQRLCWSLLSSTSIKENNHIAVFTDRWIQRYRWRFVRGLQHQFRRIDNNRLETSSRLSLLCMWSSGIYALTRSV